jgi:hypothetical protein
MKGEMKIFIFTQSTPYAAPECGRTAEKSEARDGNIILVDHGDGARAA